MSMKNTILSFLKNNKVVVAASLIPIAIPFIERLLSKYVSGFWKEVVMSPFNIFYSPVRLINDVLGIITLVNNQVAIFILPIIYTGIVLYVLKKLFTQIFYHKYLTYSLRSLVALLFIIGLSLSIYNSYKTYEQQPYLQPPQPPKDRATEDDPLVIEQTSSERGNVKFRYTFYNNQTKDIRNGNVVFPDCIAPGTEKTPNLSISGNTFSVQKGNVAVGTFTVNDWTEARSFVCNVGINNTEDTKIYDQVGVKITER